MPATTYAVGDRVRVIDGPLAGFDAEVRGASIDKLRLDADVRGMRVPIETHLWQVATASAQLEEP